MTTDAEIRRAETPDNLDEFPEPDAYLDWQHSEGVKVIVDFAFEDLGRIELGDWERKGGKGAIINIPNPLLLNDSHLVEIGPGGSSTPEHHLYEEMVYIVFGRGATSVWLDGGAEQTFEWSAGSLFSIPLNAWYRHYNASGAEPARYLGVTNAPPVLRWWRNRDFVFDNDFRFTDRFGGSDDFFSGAGTLYQRRKWASNFIPNAPGMPLYDYLTRGAGGVNASLEMAGNVTKAHISEFPVGTYKKAHRHGPGAHLVILSGEGFSLLWNDEAQSDLRKADWKVGGMVIVPADRTLHQHFNAGPTRARYLALRPGTGLVGGPRSSDLSVQEGGGQIEYEDESRRVHEIFEAELAKNGAPCRMKSFIPWCSGEVGPTRVRDT